MRLRRLKLENWRGVDRREIRFGDGVTLIEGPNEIGKSTMVEALLTLIRELDSSKKQAIKAVMPAGRDVGSSVEAEIETGPYHFVYAKTYNKSPQTTLEILAPRREQLAGREAHERAEAILNETVDLALWEALLVEQGVRIAPADFRDSEGLARALDEAAGGAATHEDTDLYEAVQVEYERYFTLKAGRPKFAELETAAERAGREHADAEAALAEVERDAEDFERASADVRRRQAGLPALKDKLGGHERSWQAVAELRRELELKRRDLDAAKDRSTAAARALEERTTLAEALATDEKTLSVQKRELQPLADRAGELETRADAARQAAEARKQARNAARDALAVAREDATHLEDRERLARDERRLEAHAGLSSRLREVSKTVAAIAIDDAGLDALRTAERDHDVASRARDLAATTVTVTAERPLDLAIDDESLSLQEGESAERAVAAGLDIRLPGVAAVTVTPPRSAAELEAAVSEAEAELGKLLERYRVDDLAEAIKQNEARRAAREEIARLKTRAGEILGEDSPEELVESVRSLRERTEAYLARRDTETEPPATLAEAREILTDAEQTVRDEESALEKAQAEEARRRDDHARADEALRTAREALIGLEATLKDKNTRLAAARAETPDEALAAGVEEAAERLNGLEAEVTATGARLEELAPDAIEALYTNAKAALERAERDQAEAERDRAVLADRLQRARADGRFEALEAAERRLEDARSELAATRRRAAAAERLWITLNRHRDAARQAYVRPLKEAIERLGRIVFGPTFEVAIGDDWALESRTLDGTTLPFDALSVGAREQLGILARLAAARIVAREGGVPLIIDDALGFSDPTRLETMGAAISAAGRECQIIILTCTPGRFTHVGEAEVVGF